MSFIKIVLVTELVLAALIAGCQGEIKTETTGGPVITKTVSNQVEVTIEDLAFHPQEISISPGTRVVWKNLDSVTHTVTSFITTPDEDLVWHTFLGTIWDSGNLAPGESFSLVLTQPGQYDYVSVPYLLPKIKWGEYQTLYIRPTSDVSGTIIVLNE